MSKAVFEEKQRFGQWWVWAILLAVLGLSVNGIWNKENIQTSDVVVPAVAFGLVAFLLLGSTLKTRIDEKGVHVKFFPFILKTHSYSWEDLYSVEIATYSPLADFGGWGYRISFKGKGRAYNVKGNKGIQLITSDGKKRLIGTQKPEEAKQIINTYFQQAV